MQTSKHCSKCAKLLPMEAFSKNADKRCGGISRRKSVCKQCTNAAGKVRRDSRKQAGICLYCETPAMPNSNKCGFHVTERHRWRATITARVNEMLISAKRRAKDYGTICAIDSDWIREKLQGNCELTGLRFDFEHGGRVGHFNPFSPSIDRKQAGGPYTPENCRMILTALNVGINFWGEATYRKIAIAYLRHRREKSVTGTRNWLLEKPLIVRSMKH